jgi:hypothetical protein
MIRARLLIAPLFILAALFAVTPSARAQTTANYVAGSLINFGGPAAPNGAWSWFEDERAIVDASDPNNVYIITSAVTYGPTGNPNRSDISLLWYNVNRRISGQFELHDRLEVDDHNSAALIRRPDGRYLAMYSKHGTATDNPTRFRISTNPGDPTAWRPAQTFDHAAAYGADRMPTYSNLHYLAAESRMYNFTRTLDFDPNIMISNDAGNAWAYGGRLLAEGGPGDRPYLKYASDGDDSIHLITTQRHPRNFNNSIYHGFIASQKLHRADGMVVDPNLFDGTAVAPSNLTPVFLADTIVGGQAMTHAWTTDIALDPSDHPYVVFTTRVNSATTDHRFFYARYDGAAWNVHPLAKAGGFLYDAEADYTGLAALDPHDPNTLYISTPIDPRSDAPLPHYEIFKGTTADGGANWSWMPINFNSSVDNLRRSFPGGTPTTPHCSGCAETTTPARTGIRKLLESSRSCPNRPLGYSRRLSALRRCSLCAHGAAAD